MGSTLRYFCLRLFFPCNDGQFAMRVNLTIHQLLKYDFYLCLQFLPHPRNLELFDGRKNEAWVRKGEDGITRTLTKVEGSAHSGLQMTSIAAA